MCYSLGGSRGPPVVLALLCFALCLTFFFLGQEFLRRPGEGTRMGVLSVCLGALVRPCWLSLRSDCGLVAPCPQASHPAGPDPRRSGFPSCVTRFFGSWRRAAVVFVLLFVKFLLDIYRGEAVPAFRLNSGPVTRRKCCKHPNFVTSSGCDIPPLSPKERFLIPISLIKRRAHIKYAMCARCDFNLQILFGFKGHALHIVVHENGA